jgi:hypothetical protein
MKQLRIILPVLLILTLATLACGLNLSKTGPASGGEEPAAQPTEASSAEVQPLPAEPTKEQPQPSETGPAAVEEATEPPAESAEGDAQEEAPLDLNTSISGLENLNSYRNTFRVDWNGTKGGEPVTGFLTMSGAYVREPAAQEIHFEGQGSLVGEDQGPSNVTFIQVGDTAWFYESESDTWAQLPAGSLDFAGGFFFAPQEFLSEFNTDKGQRSLLPQEVNGVQCYKYTFDEKDFIGQQDLTQGEVTRAKGEAYVAVDGGYVVRFNVDADVRYTDPDQVFQEGTITMAFDVFDINQPITIEPPAEAKAQAGGREDIPMLPDAQVEFSSAGMTSYRTGSSVEEAAKFYEDEMPKNGWTAEEGNAILPESAFLGYTKGNETATFFVGADENGTSVLITVAQE